MAAELGMNVSRVRTAATQLTAQLSTVDHIIAELSVTSKAAINPQSYGVDPGEKTIAPWSVGNVRGAKTELQSARAAIAELAQRLRAEADAQVAASGNAAQVSAMPALRIAGTNVPTTASVPPLGDAELLAYLAGLSAEELAAAIAGNPDIAAQLAGMSPEEVADWWNSLLPEQKRALIESMPQTLGNLEGVEYWARDEANRAYLATKTSELKSLFSQYVAAMARNDQEEMERILSESGYTEQGLTDAYAAAININNALEQPGNGKPPIRQLVSFDIEGGEPLAAISVGDLDAADNVTMLVPGIETTVQDNMSGWASTAQNLWSEQHELTKHEDNPRTTAVVAWLGYDTPGSAIEEPAVFENASAQTGGELLAHALDGVRATLDFSDNSRKLDVVALSYGSTTAFSALTESSAGTLIVLGSTGPVPSIQNAGDVDVRPGQVWATESSWDHIADIGRSGRQDPTSDAFGAEVFSSEGTLSHEQTNTHGGAVHEKGGDSYGYLDRRTESLYNIALITLDYEPSRPGDPLSGGGGGW